MPEIVFWSLRMGHFQKMVCFAINRQKLQPFLNFQIPITHYLITFAP